MSKSLNSPSKVFEFEKSVVEGKIAEIDKMRNINRRPNTTEGVFREGVGTHLATAVADVSATQAQEQSMSDKKPAGWNYMTSADQDAWRKEHENNNMQNSTHKSPANERPAGMPEADWQKYLESEARAEKKMPDSPIKEENPPEAEKETPPEASLEEETSPKVAEEASVQSQSQDQKQNTHTENEVDAGLNGVDAGSSNVDVSNVDTTSEANANSNAEAHANREPSGMTGGAMAGGTPGVASGTAKSGPEKPAGWDRMPTDAQEAWRKQNEGNTSSMRKSVDAEVDNILNAFGGATANEVSVELE